MISSIYKYKTILWSGVFIFGAFLFPTLSSAAVVSIKAPSSVSIGDRISVDILVDPQDQSINSVESNINFSNEFFSFNGFSVKQSSIPIWVEEPKDKHPQGGGGVVHFSGVIPGGLERLYDPIHTNNKSIPIVRLFFIAKKAGTTNFTASASSVLENDGKGTAVPTSSIPAEVNIIAIEGRDASTPILEDTTPPSPFTISFIERSLFGKTPRLALFSAEDDKGGINRYEVAVGNLGFHVATSPFSLPYRLFPYTLTVRAYDYSGNMREQQVTISGENPYGLGFALALLVIILGILRYRYIKSKKP